MEILEYRIEMLGELAALYNKGIYSVPNCWPVDEAEFAEAVPIAGATLENKTVQDSVVRVATQAGKLVGFAHVGTDCGRSEEANPRGAICFLYYERGHRTVGQALLEAAEQTFSERSLADVCAFDQSYRYPFYCFPHSYLSDHLDHVSALLQFNGYRPAGGEVFLNGHHYQEVALPDIDLEFDVELTWPKSLVSRPGCQVTAVRGQHQIGQCQIHCGGNYSKHEEAQDYGFVNWLGVEEPYWRIGLGKWLLFKARNEMLEVGYRHTAISTARDNYRAFLFYSNHGYHVVDWTYQLCKSLDDNPL